MRYLYRVPLLLIHVVAGVVLAVALLNPLSRRLFSRDPETVLIPVWSRLFLRVFGVKVKTRGEPVPDRCLFVANHLSWVDIEVLHSIRLMAFVAKDEIRRWPLVGWMASRAGTIYHQRGSPDSLRRVSEGMTRRLRNGWSVALFPEGRVGDGKRVLPFHGRLFQCAVATDAPVQPVALRFLEADGRVNASTPFRRKEAFMVNLFRLIGQRRTIAELHFCDPVIHHEGWGRRALARECRSRIVAELEARGNATERNEETSR